MRLIRLEIQSTNGRGASRSGKGLDGEKTKIELEVGRKAVFSSRSFLLLRQSPGYIYLLTSVALSGQKRMAGFSKIPKASQCSDSSFKPSSPRRLQD